MAHTWTTNERNWTATLRTAVALGDEAGVASVYSALVWQDSQQIAERAQAYLEEFAPSYFADEDLQPEALPHRLRMDLFAGSVLAYLEARRRRSSRRSRTTSRPGSRPTRRRWSAQT